MSSHPKITDNKADRIRELNDQLRTTFSGGAVCITRGVCERCDTNAIIRAVQEFDTFNGSNDPFGEHDFGVLELHDQTVFWKIDYYGPGMQGSSPDAADSRQTERVLTIFLDEES